MDSILPDEPISNDLQGKGFERFHTHQCSSGISEQQAKPQECSRRPPISAAFQVRDEFCR
jgi:hypothetical protein